MEPLEQQGGRPGGRPRPAGGPAKICTQGKKPGEPAWAGLGAGHPPELPGLEPGLGRPGAGHPLEPPGLETGLGRPGGRPAWCAAF